MRWFKVRLCQVISPVQNYSALGEAKEHTVRFILVLMEGLLTLSPVSLRKNGRKHSMKILSWTEVEHNCNSLMK